MCLLLKTHQCFSMCMCMFVVSFLSSLTGYLLVLIIILLNFISSCGFHLLALEFDLQCCAKASKHP